MKKHLAILMVAVLSAMLILNGCTAKQTADYTVDLAQTPVSTDYNTPDIEVKEKIRVDFIVPESGYIKLLSYDCTEHEEWPEILPEAYATFVDENGNELYPETPVYGGYTDKYLFEAGKVTAIINYKNLLAETNSISLIWAFAPDNDEAAAVEVNGEYPAAARINADGKAKFSFTATEDALYYFTCGEACIFESDCNFYIETAGGEKLTGDINIHGTEWATRWAFLPKGNYTVTVFDIGAVASCKIGTEKAYDSIVLQPTENLQLPVDFGFNALNSGEKSVKFTSDGSSKKLVVKAVGTGSYYDYEQGYTLKITDSSGNTVLYNEDDVISDYYYEGEHRFDLTGYTGEYTVTVSSSDACVVSISIE